MVDKDEFRKKIIISAGQIFSRYGFRKTTMDELAKALKMGKSSIYYYFKSKEEIFEAVILSEANMLRNELTKAIKSVDSPIDKVKNYVFVRMKTLKNFQITTMQSLTRTSIISILSRLSGPSTTGRNLQSSGC